MSGVDLEAYFRRIGYEGPREPTLAVLRQLHVLHPAAIPFEALDVLTGVGIDLSPPAVDAKLIGLRRGGYCFEQNSLFARVLRTLGFEVEPLIARSLWGRSVTESAPRTHMALRVLVEGEPWLADVGMGGCMLTAPVRLDRYKPQPTRLEPVRLQPHRDELRFAVLLNSEWRPIYDLCLSPQHGADFVAPNWFMSTHPNSPFRQHLIVSRTTPDGRYGLIDNRLGIRRPDCPTELRVLTAEGLAHSLEDDFGLTMMAAWGPTLADIAARRP